MATQPIRLLLLEDNIGDARLVQLALDERAPGEFAVLVAERLSDAKARLGAEAFDVVLSDLGLPDSTGMATVRALGSLPGMPPLVVLTGSDNEDLGREAIRNGAQDYLVKGEASGSLLARTLRHAIERRRFEDRLRHANEDLERRVAERTRELNEMLESAQESRRTLLSMAEDVQREAQGRRRGEERYRRLVERSPDILYRYSPVRGGVFYAGRVAEILGYGSDHLCAHPFLWAESIHPEDRARVDGAIRSIQEEGRDFDIEYRVRDARGSWRWLNDRSTALIREDGDVFIEGLAGDITAKKDAEERIGHYVDQLQAAFMQVVEVATNLSELRDPYTAGHERRVAKLAAEIGAELGFDERRQEGLRVSGHLHDVGNISVPTEILCKPGALGTVERSLIQGHCQSGHEVLKGVRFPWPVAQVALQHHERMDGSGYPQGLMGDEILLEARIVAVADVVEAMNSHRPYRAALGSEAALAEIEAGAGSIYDPDVAAACVRLFREKSFAFDP